MNSDSILRGMFKDKVVLITGGTGYLGRCLVRRFLGLGVSSIRLFSRDEVKHHLVQEMFGHDGRLRSLIGDVRDIDRLRKAVRGVDYVIHAAALKRLDLIEYNVEESIKTNVLGTLNVANVCLEANVKTAVFVSTDKACSPVNTYGAGKFVGERIFTETNFSKGSSSTIFTCVRYGNVMESTGSVIPLFLRKMREGQKIPLTSEEMTRFFITPDEAVDLVLKAFIHGVGGEVFVPILPAFRIVDLISVLRNRCNSKAEVEVIGLRPGEKIHEQMINSAELDMSLDLGHVYAISSCIDQFQDHLDVSRYGVHRRLDLSGLKEYSSEHNLRTQEELASLLERSGVLV